MPKPQRKEERGFRYQKRDKDSLKERANMKGGNYDSYIKPKFKQWKPKEGKNIIRILPPTWEDARHYGLDIFVNFNIGPDNQSYLSLSKHDKGPDPLAEARREAMADGEKDFAKKLNPSQRILYWIIDRMDEDEGPLLWAAPFTFDKSLSNLCIDEDTKEVIFIDDPAKGRDVRFYREGTGLKTEYDPSKMKVLKEGPIHDDEGIEGEWLDFITENPLPEVLNFYDYDHIKAQFGGGGTPDDDDEDRPARSKRRAAAEDEDEKPSRSTRRRPHDEDEDEKPARSSRRKVEPDDEEEEKPRSRSRAGSRDAEPDEDEDEKPSRGKASRRQAADDADPDDEEDEKPARSRRKVEEPDDEDEDEKPARRGRARREDPDEDEDEDPPSTRRTAKGKRGEDEDEEGGGSLREKLAARRRSRNSEDD